MTEKQYDELVKARAPKSTVGLDCAKAFVVGGIICTLGQLLIKWYTSLGLSTEDAPGAASQTLVVLAAILTGLSLFDDIAKHAGAGTLVPITGFANAIAAPAVEFQTDECDIIGLSRKAP